MFNFCLILVYGGSLAAQVVDSNSNEIVNKGAASDSIKSAKIKKKSPNGAMLRSLALPGWGQFYNEQVIKGLIVIAGRGTILGYTIYYNNRANEFPKGSPEREFYKDRRNLTFWLQGAATLLSMLDAYIDAYLYDFDAGPDLAVRVGALNNVMPVPDKPVFGLSLHVTF